MAWTEECGEYTSDLCEPLTIVLGSLSRCSSCPIAHNTGTYVYSTHTVHMNAQCGHIGVCCEVHPCGVVTTQTWVCVPGHAHLDMHTRYVSTVLTHLRCADIKAVSVLCAVCVLQEHTHPYAVHTMCTRVSLM